MNTKLDIKIYREAREGMNRQIALQIENFISAKVLKPFDKLPGEAALAKKLSVSRDVVRRAYRILSELNLIESKSTTGWFVKETGSKSN